MGAKISKRDFSYKSQPKVLKLVLNFPPNGPHKTILGFLKVFSFLTICFENSKITIVAYGETKILNYLGNE